MNNSEYHMIQVLYRESNIKNKKHAKWKSGLSEDIIYDYFVRF